MDLDFSFALVSLLTPRRKVERSSPTEVLKKTKSLKSKTSKIKNHKGNSHLEREEKENILSKEQLMKKNEFLKPTENKKNSSTNTITSRESNETSGSFSINMENIAVRRNRTRGRKEAEPNPLRPCGNVLETSDDNVGTKHLPNDRLSPGSPDVINISSDIDENCLKTTHSKIKKARGKSCLNRHSDNSVVSSPDVVDSSCSEVIGDSFDKCRNLRSLSAKKKTKMKTPMRTSGVSETSLSTAYDSDSFQTRHRHGTKVIVETPETDLSLSESSNRQKCSIKPTSEENQEIYSLRSRVSESPKKNVKRKSSELCDSPDENDKKYSFENPSHNLRLKRNSSLSSYVSEKYEPSENIGKYNLEETKAAFNDQLPKGSSESTNKMKTQARLNKKLRSSNDSSCIDMFKLESTIKIKSPSNKVKIETSKTKLKSSHSKNENQDIENVTVLEGKNKNEFDFKIPNSTKYKIIDDKEITDQKKCVKQKPDDGKSNVQKFKINHRSPISPKTSTLVLPSEVIPKFEHINQWLRDTQEKTISSSVINHKTTDVISLKDIMPVKNKYKVSLSPRIKKKKDKAKTSLEEEQKIFEELYGAGYNERLSGDPDEVASSSEDSVEFSDNVLDKLYGTVWQDTAITQSEPRKGRKKKTVKKKSPLTERKKHRTSIYEVFSSSSSEDRFEEFLENVQRGKVESTRRHSGRPETPEFINDSESDNGSLVFYQNFVSSAVKDEVNNLKKHHKATEDTHKVNRRRLSFGSSKDDGCSESGKSDTKLTTKGKKSSNEDKRKPKKARSKTKHKYIEEKDADKIDVFSLVTPIKIKGKKAKEVTNSIQSELPRSVGKTRTPKSQKPKDPTSEERLKDKYLNCDFKVPKSASKICRTPITSVGHDVPSSPALSFLSSLSDMTAGLPCHPDALVYKKHFKTKKEELTKRLFTLYNKEVFDQQLPSDMLIQWNSRMTSTSGYCYNKRIYRGNEILRSSRIVLSNKILDRADRLRDTLVHELCHAATWIINATSDGHGPIWRSWADKANRRFPELPVIKRCHDYAISTKFTYKCMSCGYCIGRHSKSLDTERKRCGFCFGKFQVFVTAKMASASATSGSDSVKTPRNPTGFALFVKENYAITKKENNVPHAQVMKLLSQKFAEVKISKKNTDEPILIE